MNIFKKGFESIARKVVDLAMGNGLSQKENWAEGSADVTPGMGEKIREVAEEAVVLLKNESTLPLKKGQVLSVFGRCQIDWFYVGYGSGGDVHPPYEVSFHEGLKNQGIVVNESLKQVYETWCSTPENVPDHGWWGHWPYHYPEMPLTQELVADAAKKSDVAAVIIGRAAGEDRENVLEPGSYYLTQEEQDMLRLVCGAFSKVVLILDCGNIIDLSFLDAYSISAVLYAWQLGQESGNALAGILSGAVNPSGKLADTIAKRYEDYPTAAYFGEKEFNNYVEDIYVGYRYFETFAKDKVLFPFGFGLSYTSFSIEKQSLNYVNGTVTVDVKVTNTGSCPGKEVVQLYCIPPKGCLSKPAKILVGFSKTKLLAPGESQMVEISMNQRYFASYDDAGDAGHKSSFVLEAGEYIFLVGNSVNADCVAGRLFLEHTELVEECHPVCALSKEQIFNVLDQECKPTKAVTATGRDLRKRILEHLPEEIKKTEHKNLHFSDVKAGRCTLDAFIAQLSDRELVDLNHGEGGMGSALGPKGNAGAFGGITPGLRKKGIPALITADGPAGVRLQKFTALLPCGTAIACTWNIALVEELFKKEGQEAASFGVDVLLSPGMNIHRNPLCGRNFEYYAEDPVLSGKIAAAAVRGIQKGGVSACPKHFACNHQEVNRNYNDSRVSERALREIYLRNFEICVKEGHPENLMTSYNKINGVWSHYNYDLVTTVLREEWGYEGNVVTDWWMRKSPSPEFPDLEDNAYRVRAQVDVLMPGSMSHLKNGYYFDKAELKTLGKPDGLTRGELQRCAKNVLNFALTRL